MPRPALLLLDVAAVGVFVAIGRRSHAEGETLVGLAGTAWPFLVGTAAGWALSRAGRRPAELVPTGVTVWGSAVVVGLLLRRLTGGGTPLPFVVVATISLGVLLLGWRALARRPAQLPR